MSNFLKIVLRRKYYFQKWNSKYNPDNVLHILLKNSRNDDQKSKESGMLSLAYNLTSSWLSLGQK